MTERYIYSVSLFQLQLSKGIYHAPHSLADLAMILSSETYATPVFHLLKEGHYAAVLENSPYPTPTFVIQRLKTDQEPIWRVQAEYDIGFTENMLQRTDVLTFMVQAQQFVDTSNIGTIRSTVTRLLTHWSKTFPQGIPDVAF